MSGLPRDVIKWLQSLGLKHSFLNPQWDVANAVLISEILRKYDDSVFTMNILEGFSIETRLYNWNLIKKALKKMNISIPDASIEGCVHCKHGAGRDFLVKLFEHFAQRGTLSFYEPTIHADFCNYNYKSDTPMYQRCTATSAIRANFKDTEKMVNKDLAKQAKRSRTILKDHNERIAKMKQEQPGKFCYMEKVADVAIRCTPPPFQPICMHPEYITNEEMKGSRQPATTITNKF